MLTFWRTGVRALGVMLMGVASTVSQPKVLGQTNGDLNMDYCYACIAGQFGCSDTDAFPMLCMTECGENARWQGSCYTSPPGGPCRSGSTQTVVCWL